MSKLTGRQAMMLFSFYYLGTATSVLPNSLVSIAKQDAWLSVILGMCLHFLTLPLLFLVSKYLQKQPLGDYLQSKLGKWAGKILLAIFVIVFPYLNFLISLYFLGNFITTSIMPATPSTALYALILIPIIYVLHYTLNVIGRTAEILFFIILVFFTFLMVSLLPIASFSNVLPVLEYGFKPIVTASFPLLSFPYIDSVLFLFLLPHVKDNQVWKKAIIKASALTGIIFLLVTFLIIAVLSPTVIANVNFASYFAVRTISISDFYERFDGLFTIILYTTIFFKMSLLLFITAEGLASTLNLTSPKPLLLPLSLIAIALADAIAPSTTFMFLFLRTSWVYYALLLGLSFLFLLWLLHFRKQQSPLPK
ncbi:endospore germination permease [Paenibacillus yanchengensis]|uniref:Endospore germination permease n=1 Tax=Paenibacillus yanchengensis TaxID=2035833 RepID=A0ABW4YRB0_9BACL